MYNDQTARRQFSAISQRFGGGKHPTVFSETHKTELARKGYTQRASHLLPARESILFARQLDVNTDGWENLCINSTRGCRHVCLSNSGRLAMTQSQRAAFVRSYVWQTDTDLFTTLAMGEVDRFVKSCDDQPVVRFFGTHDGQAETDPRTAPVVDAFDNVIFNDYTKLNIATGWATDNVYRCRSGHENMSVETIRKFIEQGVNITLPLDLRKSDPLPDTLYGCRVVDGDRDDLRFLDPDGVIVALRYKVAHGRSKADAHGFVRSVPVMAVQG